MMAHRLARWSAMFFVGSASAFLGDCAFAETISLQPARDATIFANAAGVDTGSASGKGPGLFVGADGNGSLKRSLVGFDLTTVPAGATVTGASLTMYVGQIPNGTGSLARTIGLFSLQQAWNEGNSGAPTSATIGGGGQGYAVFPGDVTWANANYDAANPTPWSQGGVLSPGGSAASTASVSLTISSPAVASAYTWSGAGLLADVQRWAADPATNNGWLLKSSGESALSSFVAFWSREGAVASTIAGSEAPVLTVTYSVPEPKLALVGLPAVALIRRRRGQ